MKLTATKREWISKIFGAVLCLILLSTPAGASSAATSVPYNLTLAWTRNSSHTPEVAGYHIYYGTASKNYTNNMMVGNVATCVVSGLTAGVTYFFAVTAYNTNGLESGFSKEFRYMLKATKTSETPLSRSVVVSSKLSLVPLLAAVQMPAASILSPTMPATAVVVPVVQIRMASSGQFVLTVSGQTGHTYDILATQTFADWTVIGAVTLDASGSQDFTDTNAANFPQRFYRISDTQP
jgi:hypothetical protein